jgi:hypothetical protein
MRWMAFMGAALLAGSAAGTARAWDGHTLWYDSASGANPGGGGIIGTGGVTDYNITCAHCHTDAMSQIDVQLAFTPPLEDVGGEAVYAPGQTYQVAVTLVGEYLGTSGCEMYMARTNNFAATVEDVSGKVAGVLASDSGQSSTNCPQDSPGPGAGTTLMYRDCHAVFSNGAEDRTSWAFSWTAPAAGSGQLTLYYGAVDGNCDMTSKGDDVKVGTLKLGEAMAARAPGRGAPAGRLALLGLVPLGLGAALLRRRSRR